MYLRGKDNKKILKQGHVLLISLFFFIFAQQSLNLST